MEVPMGRAITKIQDAFGIHAYDMAELLGIQRREMSLIMLDKATMREETREKFHEVFGIDPLYSQWDPMLAEAAERFKAARS